MQWSGVRNTAVALGVLALVGCGGSAPTATPPHVGANGSTSASSAPSGGSSSGTTTPSSPASPSSPSSSAADPLGTLPTSSFRPSLITAAQVAAYASDMVAYDAGAADSQSGDVVGTGGTCPALAKLINSDDVFSTAPAHKEQTAYDNSGAISSVSDLRDVEETLESYPALDTARELGGLRTNIAGCHSALKSSDGTTVLVTPGTAPTGYGTGALAFQERVTVHGTVVRADCLAIASGHNVLGLVAGQLSAAQEASLLRAAWSDLGHPAGSI
ncbi:MULTISPECIES: hypothetical protein [unclassified Allobranchiibius]|uniref:hypothetical protein n=1 Tax=unclassified Allobranchiibius TaxID=2649857 RepID=UPI001AA0B5A1|nr:MULTISPECIES: hypothetical protein [unclassified Allobranchiibius]MBO1767642.1 hypothetical protein [Allobranchiibius sp. GilTou38]UIJ36450.1 hypothetical protein LVQ62_08865 [Allobranchiibius sp. GilTou73]